MGTSNILRKYIFVWRVYSLGNGTTFHLEISVVRMTDKLSALFPLELSMTVEVFFKARERDLKNLVNFHLYRARFLFISLECVYQILNGNVTQVQR